MRNMKHFPMLIFILLILLLFGGCGQEKENMSSNKTENTKNIMVFAGAGLKDALPEVAKKYNRLHPDIKISFNFAGLGVLQQQIEQGASCDILLGPGEKQWNTLRSENLIDKLTEKKILSDKMVLVTPKESQKVKSFQDLTLPDVDKIAIGDPALVPGGEWAKDVLTNLGLWDKVSSKIILAKDVQEIRGYIETGNVDAGLLWKSNTTNNNKIRIVADAPENSCPPIFFRGAVINSSQEKETALDFLNYLKSQEASQVFKKYGYVPLDQKQ
ncbi:molybdate ABC transporter substrate-binding protein [Thermoanaerobacterium saccharolyticum]|uniref:Molybdenum ABC transporter periplasmic molybdate-binding protein n=2 Tax=Thermoanaerobacterium TaxID=28895 RepID=W9EEC9_9THEO|nr:MULTISPECIES: molybdate ABC transporter substrate-binding protein [Thermoanaerobacterium]AFK87230.1 molybdenum ABC transporter, periplasmic molybdate-binding protein [Thermoanaerobacterium saccharolyticum JW/SL-YS485]ETO38114.1 molybdenum ABC transporter periplasmic molybdate-binding protein [Thermoanaerobacterium aotearoense SCUT27]